VEITWTKGGNALSDRGKQLLGDVPVTMEGAGLLGYGNSQSLVQTAEGRQTGAGPTLQRWRRRVADLTSVPLQRRAPEVALVGADLVAVYLAGALVGVSLLAGAVLAALVAVLNAAGGSYRFRLSLNLLDDVPALTTHVLGAAAGLLLLPPALAQGGARLWWPILVGTVLAAILVLRACSYAALRAVRRRFESSRRPTLVLGSGRVAGRMVRCLEEHPEYGLRVIGNVSDGASRSTAAHHAPRLGYCHELSEVVHRTGARVVVVAFTSTPSRALVEALHGCARSSCEIYVVPRLFEVQRISYHMDRVWELPLQRLPRPAFRSPTWRLKSLFDLVMAATALLVLSPVLLACAVAVACDSGRPVLFRQERVGLGGRPFTLLKFRTLTPADHTESEARWNIAGDDRLTRTGRFLRRTSLDELPQLFNVLAGQMSLVGPRPERAYFVERFSRSTPGYGARHRVRPGITGLAQVHGLRGDTSIEERAAFDNIYIENWSLWNDIKILVLTVRSMTRGAG
jgi:exopolysaccharide biosynthesis polyprenyl glycosylphosphotransferase